LYENLSQEVASIKEYQPGTSLIIPGLIWLFQLLLLATFRTKLKNFLPADFNEAYINRSTEGIGLAMLRYGNISSRDLFSIAYEALLGCDTFIPSLAPFTKRVCGPETNAIWQAYLTHTLLSSRTKGTDPFRLYGYQPNLVARQFGLVQPRPSSLYKCADDLKQPLIESTWRALLCQV
jgi:hypothetical protein